LAFIESWNHEVESRKMSSWSHLINYWGSWTWNLLTLMFCSRHRVLTRFLVTLKSDMLLELTWNRLRTTPK
jgi:hypothetical protein